MTTEELDRILCRKLCGDANECSSLHYAFKEDRRAALRERDARWAAAVNAALGICIWPYHEVCDRCRPFRALLEEAGK